MRCMCARARVCMFVYAYVRHKTDVVCFIGVSWVYLCDVIKSYTLRIVLNPAPTMTGFVLNDKKNFTDKFNTSPKNITVQNYKV